MFSGLRSFAQNLASGFMETPVTIHHRTPFAKDPSNPKGDDTTGFSTTTTTVNGWFVSSLTKGISDQGSMVSVAEDDLIRFPVGTAVSSGDKLVINGHDWYAVDVSDEETWPAMLKVTITRISGA